MKFGEALGRGSAGRPSMAEMGRKWAPRGHCGLLPAAGRVWPLQSPTETCEVLATHRKMIFC